MQNIYTDRDRAQARRLAWRRLRLTALVSIACNLVMLILVIVLLCTRTTAADMPNEVDLKAPEVTDGYLAPQSSIITCELRSEVVHEPICAGEYIITAYCPCVKCCGIWSEDHPSRVGTDYIQKTASGTIPTEGRTIAADPDVLPFGTVVIIDGHEFIVEDRGGAINGNRIDIFFESHQEALNWGVQTKTIYIKGE